MSLTAHTHTDHAQHDDGLAWVIDIDPTQPTCKREGCRHVPWRRGLCHGCWTPKPKPQPKFNPADRLEDLRWMLDTGESAHGCCHRLGINSHALARWLTRHQEHELARIFYGLDKQRQAAA